MTSSGMAGGAASPQKSPAVSHSAAGKLAKRALRRKTCGGCPSVRRKARRIRSRSPKPVVRATSSILRLSISWPTPWNSRLATDRVGERIASRRMRRAINRNARLRERGADIGQLADHDGSPRPMPPQSSAPQSIARVLSFSAVTIVPHSCWMINCKRHDRVFAQFGHKRTRIRRSRPTAEHYSAAIAVRNSGFFV